MIPIALITDLNLSTVLASVRTEFNKFLTAALKLTGYEKPVSSSAVAATDTVNEGIGKLEKALDGKSDTGHAHAESDITGLADDLAGKAASSHTHAESDITGLSGDLAGKADSTHTHAQTDVTGLSDALAGKVDNAEMIPFEGYITDLQDAVELLNEDLTAKQSHITASGLLKGNGYAVSAATAGTDYKAPENRITSGTSFTVADNTEYWLGSIASLTVTAPSSGYWECWMRWTASTASFTLTLNGTKTYIGKIPTWAASTVYEMSLKGNGTTYTAIIAEVGTGT